MTSTAISTPPAVFLMGPTASGKTDIAVELLQHFPFEIISVDSALVYRGMDIGTAKPSAELLAQAPHRLVDIIDPAQSYSAAEFRRDALREMEAIVAQGRIPLLVGGTMLYFRALEHGLSELPAADAEVRRRLEVMAEERGWAAMHEWLQRVDPVSAARIHPNDPQRLQRALEVYQVTGVPMSQLHAQGRQPALPYAVLKLGLLPEDRSLLHRRIEQRFRSMLANGLVEEVRQLKERGDLHVDLPSMRSVGYRQVWEYLDGACDYDEMVQRGVAASRQLAKRQLTWMRRDNEILSFVIDLPNTFDRVLKKLQHVLI